MSKPNMTYYRLDEAIAICKPTEHVLACDTTKGNGMVGKKFFICPNLWTQLGDSTFNRLVRMNGPHFYEILQPDRATRIFMDIETTNGVYERVKAGVGVLVKMIKMWMEHKEIPDVQPLHVLDSSNAKKCSFHVVGGPLLTNPYHVGALVRRLTCFIYSARYEETATPFDFETLFDNDGNYIVDEQIYTLNRQFRLSKMTKIGSERTLNGCTTLESVLQNVEPSFVEGVDCLEIDDSTPSSTSKKATDLFSKVDDGWVRVAGVAMTMSKTKASLPQSLCKIRLWLDSWMGHGRITGCSFDILRGTYLLNTTCKKCWISNRMHKSNHTWLVINPWQRECIQKCFDENCARQQYSIPVPPDYWSTWASYMNKDVDIGRC